MTPQTPLEFMELLYPLSSLSNKDGLVEWHFVQTVGRRQRTGQGIGTPSRAKTCLEGRFGGWHHGFGIVSFRDQPFSSLRCTEQGKGTYNDFCVIVD